ncbi:FtsH protease activity modulator HflK [Vibrio coralliirubri]|uniref:FtsH protease activity modulator HflK n=1 Tax=Vibrio coralliirubri TaxID=1516159 RepID=UPI00228387D6|nr:FtsH protease activity modulator HflK [Vibrio coralliirubri]MCY9861163.1 FtsH protease activity modulator HflK [Vibrio coralliirubri]
MQNALMPLKSLLSKGITTTVLVGNVAVFGLMGTVGSFYTVSEAESAMVFRLGQYVETKSAGLHWNFPILDSIKVVDVESIYEIGFQDTLLTLDENVIVTAFTVQYKISDPYTYVIQAEDPEEQLVRQAESAARAVIADFSMDDAITTGRDAVTSAIESKLNDMLMNHISIGVEVVALNYVSGEPPARVKSAFDDAINAREDAENYINQALAYQEDVLPKAKGQANKIINQAKSYREEVVNQALGAVQGFDKLLPEFEKNPELTKSRIYYDTVRGVIQNNTVIINDGDGQGSLPPIQTVDINKLVAATKVSK